MSEKWREWRKIHSNRDEIETMVEVLVSKHKKDVHQIVANNATETTQRATSIDTENKKEVKLSPS